MNFIEKVPKKYNQNFGTFKTKKTNFGTFIGTFIF